MPQSLYSKKTPRAALTGTPTTPKPMRHLALHEWGQRTRHGVIRQRGVREQVVNADVGE
jgi:hypothetical protein